MEQTGFFCTSFCLSPVFYKITFPPSQEQSTQKAWVPVPLFPRKLQLFYITSPRVKIQFTPSVQLYTMTIFIDTPPQAIVPNAIALDNLKVMSLILSSMLIAMTKTVCCLNKRYQIYFLFFDFLNSRRFFNIKGPCFVCLTLLTPGTDFRADPHKQFFYVHSLYTDSMTRAPLVDLSLILQHYKAISGILKSSLITFTFTCVPLFAFRWKTRSCMYGYECVFNNLNRE